MRDLELDAIKNLLERFVSEWQAGDVSIGCYEDALELLQKWKWESQ